VLRYITYRLLQLPLLLLVVSAIVFFALRLGPASPVDVATEAARDPAEIARIKHEWGLDRPLLVQYADYVWHAVQGDFGRSLFSNVPVSKAITERFPATIELTIAAMILGALFGIGAGVISAVRENSWIDVTSRTIALLGISAPTFWIGLMLISLFAVRLGWLPVAGRFDSRVEFPVASGFYIIDSLRAGNTAYLLQTLRYMVMPTFVLALFVAGFIARITRVTVLESLRQDYVRTARAKGLDERVVIVGHALRNALLPIVTIMGLQFGNLLGGAAVTETIFAWPGLGKLMVDAVYVNDFPQIQASVMLLATTYMVVNLVVDVLYAFIDPRIRLGK